MLKSVNPYTGKLIRQIPEIDEQKTFELINLCDSAFHEWRQADFGTRNRLMLATADLLRRNSHDFGKVITSEMGKPLKESVAEVEKCAWVCEYYAENAERFLQPEMIGSDADKSYARYDPLGVILGIMPWNFPFWQVFRFAVPALMAGNTVLLKHASNVQMCAEQIEKIFSEAGFPGNAFSNLALSSGRIEDVIRNEKVKAVSLTGSEEAGRKVASAAGSVLKKCVLELGGSNAFIVLEDADLGKAAKTGVLARFQNAGQSCIAAKRFIVDKKASGEFLELFSQEIKKIRSGDPLLEDTELGPLCSEKQAEAVEDQVNRSISMGATLVLGGKRDGAIMTPALLTGVHPGMPLFDEEVFGPVAPVTVAGSTDEAIALAGNTGFGLGVSVFTRDTEKAEKLAAEFNDGAVFVNGLVKSDPRLPFGGTLNSGYGRELSFQGIREFVNVKTVWVKK